MNVRIELEAPVSQMSFFLTRRVLVQNDPLSLEYMYFMWIPYIVALLEFLRMHDILHYGPQL